jgi:hypothetical protein
MQPMGYAPAPGYGAAGPTYEFNELENSTIAGTARYARLWGIISLISGIILLLVGIFLALAVSIIGVANMASGSSSPGISPAMITAIGVALIPSSLVSIIGGIFYISSGNALRSVVDTQGNDIALLTAAVRSLSRALMIEAIAMIVGFVLGLIIGIVMQTGGAQ